MHNLRTIHARAFCAVSPATGAAFRRSNSRLLAPVMIALYLGCVEISDGVSADRKVSLTAAALANLTAQVSTISSCDMTNILDASSAIIAPYSASKLKLTVSCLKIDADRQGDGAMERVTERDGARAGSSYTFDTSKPRWRCRIRS